MCELLGISVSPAARMGVYFTRFRPRASENRSGWGIGWYEADGARLIKEPVPAHISVRATELAARPPTSELFIVHVRAATVGRVALENTHPFSADALGREWLFAHNGTIRDLERLDTGAFEEVGETDSEVGFHHLMTRLERLGTGATEDAIAAEILGGARELSAEGRVNFLLSDGRTLYAYHDGHKTLHFVEHRAEDLAPVRMADEDYRIDLRLGEATEERAVIVASVPLTDEPGWRKLDAGEFLVIREGRVEELVPAAA